MNPKILSRLLAGAVAIAATTTAAHATLSISKKATKNVTCTAGVCTATAKAASLNATDLTNMLGSGDVTVVAGNKAVDIDVAAAVAWGSSHRLTLDARTSIGAEQQLLVQGAGALTLTTNDGGSNGTLSFSGKGNATFLELSDSLVINGTPYTLVGDIATLASDIHATADGHYALAANYNAKPDGTYKTPPVTTTLSGTFEGLGNTISNLKIAVKRAHNYSGNDWAGQAGLFAYVTGRIENISLTNANVSSGDLTNAGILVGELTGTVANASSGGSVSVGNGVPGGQVISPDAGGLVGALFTSGLVSNSTSSATVTGGGSSGAGGLVGGAYNGGTITGSSASGAVSGGDNILGDTHGSAIGGLIGIVDNDKTAGTTNIDTSHASGPVSSGSGGGCTAGGFIGFLDGAATISLSSASGTAQVAAGEAGSTPIYSYAGGFVGIAVLDSNSIGNSIAQSFATGVVSGSPVNLLGGFVGYFETTIHDAYATGSVVASGSGPGALGGFAGYAAAAANLQTSYSTASVQPVGGNWIGGFVGGEFGTLASDYWDTDLSGIANLAQGAGNEANGPGITGQSTAQLQSGLPGGFNPSIWAETAGINNGLPYLTAAPPAGAARRTAGK